MSDAPAFDLAAYLARIRLPGPPPAPDAEGLAALVRAHRLAIPFENIDAMLGRPIAIDTASVFAKLVTRGRGGYCFEHNRLLLDALDALGFAARPLLARSWLFADGVPAKTHVLSLVAIDGRDWIADAGFGGGYTPPMQLAEGEEADAPDGARFRLQRDPLFGWMLERRGGSDSGGGTWHRQYAFGEAQAFPADLELANFWTSHARQSRFLQQVIAAQVLPHGLASLTGRAYRRRNGAQEAAGEIADPRVYRMRLSLMFGIDLSAEEVAALGLFERP